MDTCSHSKKDAAFLSFIQSKRETESHPRIKAMIKQGVPIDEISKKLGVSKLHVQKNAQLLERQAKTIIYKYTAQDIFLRDVSDLFNYFKKISEKVIISLFQQEKRNNNVREVIFNYLINKYQKIISYKASIYSFPSFEREDLIQEILIVFYECLYTFQTDRGIKFVTYVSRSIDKMFSSKNTSNHYQKRKANRNCLEFKNNILYNTIHDNSKSDPIRFIIFREESKRLKENLSDIEVKAFQYYLFGFSYKDIADQLGYGIKAIGNAIQRAKKKFFKLEIELI